MSRELLCRMCSSCVPGFVKVCCRVCPSVSTNNEALVLYEFDVVWCCLRDNDNTCVGVKGRYPERIRVSSAEWTRRSFETSAEDDLVMLTIVTMTSTSTYD